MLLNKRRTPFVWIANITTELLTVEFRWCVPPVCPPVLSPWTAKWSADEPLDTLGALSLSKRRRPYGRDIVGSDLASGSICNRDGRSAHPPSPRLRRAGKARPYEEKNVRVVGPDLASGPRRFSMPFNPHVSRLQQAGVRPKWRQPFTQEPLHQNAFLPRPEETG